VKHAKILILLGTALLTATSCEAGKSKGIKMEEKLEKLASEYRDLLIKPTEDRISELDFKIANLEWEGLFLTSLPNVEAPIPGIPVMAFMKRDDLDEWKVRIRKNSFLVFTNLDRGITGITPLHKPPEKKMKPQPDAPGRKPEPGEGYSAGAIRRVIGDSQPEPMAPGEYAISLISFDHITNQCRVKKEEKSDSPDPAVDFETWPWEIWADTKAFQENFSVNANPQEKGMYLKVEKQNGVIMVLGCVATTARSGHLIPPNPDRQVNQWIRAGIHIDLVLTTLDRYPPEVVRLAVPIMGSSHLQVGDSISGWFSVPFSFKSSDEDRMLYAFSDGKVAGPVRIPGEKR